MSRSPQAHHILGVERARLRTIAALGLPIIGGMVSQNVLNLVDTWMVGRLGDTALAAVGVASMANFVAVAFIGGLSAGVQAMAARRKGEGKHDQTAVPLNGGLVLALVAAVPISCVAMLAAPALFPLLNPDAPVIEQGVPYLQARFAAVAAVGCNFAFRGYWNGVSRSALYMRTLMLMHVCNVALNYALIFGKFGFPELGAAGAGVSSAIATYIGTGYYVVLGLRHARGNGFLRGMPDRQTISTMLRLAVPSGLQQLLFAAGMATQMIIISRGVGTAETAAAQVLITIMLVAVLPAIALGMASASLVGQALGRGDRDDAAQWARDVARAAATLLLLIGLPMVLLPDAILGSFIDNPETVALGRTPLRVVGATIWIDGIGLVLWQSLLGAGASRAVMIVSGSLQWGVFLPLAFVAGPVLGYGLVGIWLAQVLHRVLQATIYSTLWRRGAWADIRV